MSRWTKTLNDRFWEKVDKESSQIFYNGTRCWEWTASKNITGYGKINIGGKLFGSHRFAYELTYGEIPDGLNVLHRCDNPPCCNPDHLFLGTHSDNSKDMSEKGRVSFGENHWNSKLTEERVIKIRNEFSFGNITHTELSKKYNVSRRTIGDIVNKKLWRHI